MKINVDVGVAATDDDCESDRVGVAESECVVDAAKEVEWVAVSPEVVWVRDVLRVAVCIIDKVSLAVRVPARVAVREDDGDSVPRVLEGVEVRDVDIE